MNNQGKEAIYLDVCTLCRPFDDQSLMRIRLETNAYYLILQAIRDGRYEMIVSPVHLEEVNAIGDAQERQETLAVLERLGTKAKCDLAATRARAEQLYTRKFGIADAAHVVFAEATAGVFITWDNRLLKKCKKEKVQVTVMNPVEFVIAEDLK